MTIERLLRIHGHDTTKRELPDGKLVFDPKDPPMTGTCSCPPDDCHGGHTINIGPVTVWPAVTILCPGCRHGIDPHGSDPGGPCGVSGCGCAAEHLGNLITDQAGVDALPIGSVVLDAFAAACTRVHSDPLMGWVRATSAVPMGRHCHRPYLPVTVLYVPTEEARNA